MYEGPIQDLIDELSRLPGIGPRGASRIAFYLLDAPEEDVFALADTLRRVKESSRVCEVCFNVSQEERCRICRDPRRDRSQLCVVEESKDVVAIERTNEFRGLYHVLGDGTAMKYAISVGRKGFIWTGTNTVSRKAEWPTWNPPAEMRAREAKKGHILPVTMKGGINNPLGARAMYLGSTIYRIHGTNQPSSLGKAMSSGCIRMANEDVEHLYANVTIGTKVIVRN